ncbi:MAG TPA: DUF6377 domain-containing protein [Bacteroidales bacterium]
MKRFIVLLPCFAFSIFLFAQQDYDSLLQVLDKTVDNFQMYANQKEDKLNKLKELLKPGLSDSSVYSIDNQLFEEYRSYKSDSALKYAQEKLKLSDSLNDLKKQNEARLDLAHIWGITGMYKEALDILQGIDKDAVPQLKVRYFDIYRSVLGYMEDYAVNQEKSKYNYQMAAFRDSLAVLRDPTSSGYFIDKTYVLIAQKQNDVALKLLLAHFQTIRSEIRDKAYIAYTISSLYQKKGDRQHEKYWLTVAAINDLQSVNKEYISLSSLAFILYEEGDIDRAYKYIKRSLEDALFCNSRIRTFAISKMLPIIDKAYQAQEKARQDLLIVSLISICILSLFLLIAIFIVYKQMRKLTVARKELSKANEELFAINSQLKEVNKSLLESNMIKEEYIGRYVDQCSVYINKLDDYRRLLNKTATAGKMDDLLRTIKSKQFIEDELKAFYDTFDNTFIQLFPTFVKDFAGLLVDEEYLQLKPGQLLNTELRVYALMRLGITDVAKMAGFLRTSASTIYNYRYKIKNKTNYTREELEEKVMQIGSASA